MNEAHELAIRSANDAIGKIHGKKPGTKDIETAVSAYLKAMGEAGWKMVPTTPTEKMVNSGETFTANGQTLDLGSAWTVMCDDAPGHEAK